MRFAIPQDFSGTPGRDKFGEHFAAEVTRLLDATVEFAVGECPRPAFPKLSVAFRNKDAASPKTPGVARALAYDAAAFQNNRTKSHLRQHQSGEQTTWPATDNNRPRCEACRCSRHGSIVDIRNWNEVRIINLDMFRFGHIN